MRLVFLHHVDHGWNTDFWHELGRLLLQLSSGLEFFVRDSGHVDPEEDKVYLSICEQEVDDIVDLGGIAVLIPHPQNKYRKTTNPLNYLRNKLTKLLKEQK